jgi:hypothetical protein
VGNCPNPAEIVRAFLREMIRHREAPSTRSLPLQINLSSRIGPSKTVPERFAQDTARLRAVKNVTFSLCKSSCTNVFTLIGAHSPEKECDAQS